jgi:putative redox protein
LTLKPVATAVVRSQARYVQDITSGAHTVRSDEPVARGGTDVGPAPYDLLLAALGACTSITLRMYADRKQWELGAVEVDLRLFKTSDEERIERVVRVSGALTDAQRTRLAEICEKTPVTRTLRAGTPIVTRLEPAAP